MTDTQVQQILTIVKHMSLSKAAKELYISQPALSLSLSRVEKELNVRLFYRDGNRLTLSQAGERLLVHFKQLKETRDQLLIDASTLHNKERQKIIIAFSGSIFFFSSLYMTSSLTSFNGIQIEKIYANHSLITEMLKSEQIDFAITSAPLWDPEISSYTILHEKMVLVVSNQHPFAKQQCITLKEISACEDFIALEPGNALRVFDDELFAKNNLSIRYKEEVNVSDYHRLIEEWAGTDRFVAICPEYRVATTYGSGYTKINIADFDVYRNTSLSWLSERKLQYKYKELIDHIAKTIPQHHVFYSNKKPAFL